MSKLVAFAAIQGAYNIVSKAEGKYKQALETYGGSQKIEFPNTAYFLPIIYSLTGIKVTDLDSAKKPLEFARKLLPPHIKKQRRRNNQKHQSGIVPRASLVQKAQHTSPPTGAGPPIGFLQTSTAAR